MIVLTRMYMSTVIHPADDDNDDDESEVRMLKSQLSRKIVFASSRLIRSE